MRKVGEPSSLNALEVHGLKTKRLITCAVNDKNCLCYDENVVYISELIQIIIISFYFH